MLEQLYEDNWRYLARDPQQLSLKFQSMNDSYYAFMRGTLSLYVGRLTLYTPDRVQTQFLRSPEATLIPIFGDAHPENISICADRSQNETLEFIDLDASDYGPWIFDIRRSSLSLRVFASELDGCEQTCQNAMVSGFVEGYIEGLSGVQVSFTESVIFDDLWKEAVEEGDEQKKYHRYTTDGLLNIDAELDPEGKAIFSLTDDRQLGEEVFRQFSQKRPGEERLLDMGRRFGMGVSSRPATRFVYVWDEGDESTADDRLLLAREVMDPPQYPGRINYNTGVFEHNAERVTALAEQLWSNPTADSNYFPIYIDGLSFKTVSWTSYFQDIELHKIRDNWNDGDIVQEEIVAMSKVMGRTMGNTLYQAKDLSGNNAAKIVLEDIRLGGGADELRDEILFISRQEEIQLKQDFEWFREYLDVHGPLMGMRR